MQTSRPATRQYDKGERRFKHVGSGSEPVIECDDGNPRLWVGKCPSTILEADRKRLLNEAMAAPNGDRELAVAKKLYVVHDGAIYEAQTSDQGHTYHGYPYKGKLSAIILEGLTAMAEKQGCRDAFANWVKKYIVRHGGRK